MLVSNDSDCDSDVKYEGTHQSAFHGNKMGSEEEHDSDSDDASDPMDTLSEYDGEHARVDADGNEESNCFDCLAAFW